MFLQVRRIRLEKIEARWTDKITRRKMRRAITETLAKWHLGALSLRGNVHSRIFDELASRIDRARAN